MTDSNNSGNNSKDPAIVVTLSPNTATQAQPNQVLTWNGSSGQWISVPIATGATGSNGAGNCAGVWIPGQTYTITIGGGGGGGGSGQISFDDIDLAVPVEEKKEKSDGCSCKKCKEFYQYAEPNQDDGTLICYGCRMSW